MANPEHLAILKQGPRVWNAWRENNSGVSIDLVGAQLEKADLVAAMLWGVDFTAANLAEASLVAAFLKGCKFINANLAGASFWEAHFWGADLMGAKFANAIFGYTALGNLDLSSCEGLESTRHEGPSTVGLDTIYLSKGNIPEVFLRGCGVPDSFITYARSLAGQAIQFYSCFISYSSKDQEFADRLYADLQNNGVRCWFAPEDLKIGDPFRQRIDEAIRLHDKLLLILSEHSVESPWVRDEVEACLERERRENRVVLFPITLDDAIMDTGQAWAATIRRQRHIGDFRKWKDHDSYQQAFQRLLRDLKADVGQR
jgi:TIR domain/Pentapeptide repeats (8 copies)